MSKVENAEVLAWLGVDAVGDATEEQALEGITAAVNATVTDWHGNPDTWSDRIHTGAVMLAAHLWRRRATPGGVAALTDEGTTYVQRHDPQAAMLLGLGGWTAPAVG